MSLLEGGWILWRMGREYRIAGLPLILCGGLAAADRLLGRTQEIGPREGLTREEAP